MKKLSFKDDMKVELKAKAFFYVDSAVRYKYDADNKRTDEVEGTRVDVLMLNSEGERKMLSITIPKVLEGENPGFCAQVQFRDIVVTPYFDRRTNTLEFSVKAADMVVTEKK